MVEKRVEIQVPQIVEVNVNTNIERAQVNERVQEEFIDFDAKTLSVVQGRVEEQVSEVILSFT